jgi:phosphinothricin acetyltransferase
VSAAGSQREPAALRPGRADDAAALNAVYDHYVRETAVTFDLEPWTLARRAEWLAGFDGAGRHRLLVAELDGRVVGYACTRPFRDKRAYDTTVETSVYLAPPACGRGIGAQLYAALFASLAGADVHRLVAGITLPNAASIALHERFGFRPVGVFREVGRKHGRYWDVLWLDRPLSGG